MRPDRRPIKMDAFTQPSLVSPPEDGTRILLREIDLHQLDLRYTHTRVISSDSLRALCASLEQFGQLSPLVSVAREPLVLIDGYRRVAALKRNRKDTAITEVWPCSEQEAILKLLAKPRRWEALEEAALLRELLTSSEMSRAGLARLLGKDPSWVTRRLDLLDGLKEELLGLIRSGYLSSWAASRVMVPLARANEAHALRLASHILKEGIATRDLAAWFEHYQKSNHATREKMIEAPSLFLKALRAKAEQRQADHLREGPEGRWLGDLSAILKALHRLRKEIDMLRGADLGQIKQTLHTIKAVLNAVDEQIERMPSHVDSGSQTDDPEPPSGTDSHSLHQQNP